WGLQQPANLTVAASAGIRRTTTKRRFEAERRSEMDGGRGGRRWLVATPRTE
uniref:Uncharacterized protein n=1 Tax=Cucumis melo TaxID=3656 RepID=A0A9I9E3L8_CUCME